MNLRGADLLRLCILLGDQIAKEAGEERFSYLDDKAIELTIAFQGEMHDAVECGTEQIFLDVAIAVNFLLSLINWNEENKLQMEIEKLEKKMSE